MPVYRPFEERLWEKIDRRGPDECWPWTASLSSTGYGQINAGKKRIVRAHNAVCTLVHGSAPEGKPNALHSCDNPICCNPNHLSWGTHHRNMKEARDRKRVGPWQKLTPEQADEIRNSKARVKDLAAQYGISRWQVTNIRNRRQWKHG